MGLDVESPDFSGAMPLLDLGGFPVVFWFLLKVGVGSRLRGSIAHLFGWGQGGWGYTLGDIPQPHRGTLTLRAIKGEGEKRIEAHVRAVHARGPLIQYWGEGDGTPRPHTSGWIPDCSGMTDRGGGWEDDYGDGVRLRGGGGRFLPPETFA